MFQANTNDECMSPSRVAMNPPAASSSHPATGLAVCHVRFVERSFIVSRGHRQVRKRRR